VNEALPI